MKPNAVSAVLAAILVASCGGGSGGGGSSGAGPSPTPSPSPTSSPTPTPTPTPSYVTFDNLSGNQTFRSACSSLNFQYQPPIANPAGGLGDGLTFDYQSAPQIYSISGDGLNLSFGPSDADPSPPPGVKAYSKPGTGNITDRFVLSKPMSGSASLDYTRSIKLMTQYFGSPITYSCVIGVPTLVDDVPSTPMVTFTKNGIAAQAYDSSSGTLMTYSLSHSSVMFKVDLATLTVETSVNLVGTPGQGSDVQLGTITGTGTIDPDSGAFRGMWSSGDREAIGRFGGGFFGPQGREFGYTFSLFGRNESANEIFAAGGTIFGTR